MPEDSKLGKPIVVWLAQGVCGLVAAATIYMSRLMESSTSSAVILGLGLFYLVLLIAIQARQRWARLVLVVSFGWTALGAAMQGLGALATSSENTALLLSSAGTFVVCGVLTVHFVFGEPVKRFFASKPGGKRERTAGNPYAAPTE